MNPDDFSVEDEAARICKPIDDLIAKEADELKKESAKIDELEKKTNQLFPPAKRDDED
jgi:hypothetical protein